MTAECLKSNICISILVTLVTLVSNYILKTSIHLYPTANITLLVSLDGDKWFTSVSAHKYLSPSKQY